MTNVFPTSNLPTVSQPWGREVQKRVDILEAQFSLQKTNSATIDAQLQASYRRLDANVIAAQEAATNAGLAAAQANDAINGLLGLGQSTGSTYNINANNITAGTINASTVTVSNINASNITTGTIDASTVTITNLDADNITAGSISGDLISGGEISGTRLTTATSGQRVELTNIRAEFYNSSNTLTGFIVGTSSILYLTSAAGAGAISIGSNVTVDGTLVATGDISASGSYEVAGVTQAIIGPSGGVYPTNGTSSTGANVVQEGSSGILRRFSSSSRRYKNSEADIWSSVDMNPKKLLDIPVKIFKYNDGYLDADDQNYDKFLPGLMAEDVANYYPVAAYTKDGLVENWMDRSILVASVALVQDLYKQIESLTDRIETLENGAING